MSITTGLSRLLSSTCLLAAATLLIALGLAPPAVAVAPFALTDRVTDQVGALEGRAAEVRAALADLETEHGVRMWVVFVETFSDIGAQRWADETFEATPLGTDDFLLAVALGDRAYGYTVATNFVLGDAALARVAQSAERHLAEDPSRAVLAAADALGYEIAGAPYATPTSGSEGSEEIPTWVFLAIVGMAFAAFMGNGFRRVRKGLPFAPASGDGVHNAGFGRAPWIHGSSSDWGGGDAGDDDGTRGGSGSF